MPNNAVEEARRRRQNNTNEANESENRTYNTFEGERIKWLPISYGKELKQEKVMRIVGDPYEIENRKPTDAKIILFSEWLKDDGSGYVKIIWPFVEKAEKFKPNPDWILTRLYNAINAGGWEKYTSDMIDPKKEIKEVNGKIVNKWNKEVYWKNANSNKTCFKSIQNEYNKKVGDTFTKPIYPSAKILLNAIDRHDTWCSQEQKTKAVSSKVSPHTFMGDDGEKTIEYVTWGLPISVYKELWDNILNYRDHWEDVDVIIKLNSDTNKYMVRDALEEKITDESKKIASSDPLTDEERAYERWDFDEKFKPLTYFSMKANMFKRFQQADLDLGTTFVEELNDLLSDETTKFNEEQKNKDAKGLTEVVEDVKNEDVTLEVSEDVKVEIDTVISEDKTETVEPQKRQPRVTKKSETKEANVEDLPNWNNLAVEDKEDVVENMSSFDGDVIKWNDGTDVCECDRCRKLLPNTLLVCPYCGETFETE